MQRAPYKHQKGAMKYIRKQQHPALFMAMRSGKNLPTIRSIEDTSPRTKRLGLRVLIIAPNSAIGGWMDELDAEGIDRYTVLEGTRHQRLEALMTGSRYNLINTEGWRVIPEIASEDWIAWDHVVVDESTCLKNPQTRITKFFLNNNTLRNVPRRWALTGTPNPEGSLNFWCQMAWLEQRPFGCKNYWEFRARYFEPVMFDWVPTKDGEAVITSYLAEKSFIVTKEQAEINVKVVHEKRYLKLPSDMRKTYQVLEEQFILSLDGDEVDRTMFAGQRWHWLRQICGGFVGGQFVWQGKFNELKYLLTHELAAEQVVVWFRYNPELFEVTQRLQKAGVNAQWMCGKNTPVQRRALRDGFARGAIRVWCIQQAVASMGLDLSMADTEIFYSQSKALLQRQQCMERLVHKERTTPILAIDLVVEDSVDEDVIDSLIDKRWTSQSMINKVIREKLRARRRS